MARVSNLLLTRENKPISNIIRDNLGFIKEGGIYVGRSHNKRVFARLRKVPTGALTLTSREDAFNSSRTLADVHSSFRNARLVLLGCSFWEI